MKDKICQELEGLKYESGKRLPRPAVKGELPCLVFPQIEETGIVNHLISTRLGGVSKGCLGSLNLSFSRGDDPESVTENFRRVAEALRISPDSITFTDQTHTTNVRVVTENDRGKGMAVPRDYTDIDGLVTNVPGICLSAYFADCVPLLFVDPVHRAIGLSHSGWRGTVGRIGEKTIRLMEKTYGTRPEDLITAIGPSIGWDCYEVSEEVITACKQAFPREDWPLLIIGKGSGKYQFNLRKACERTMIEAGVKPENISVSDLCTACNSDLLFSHRATGGKRGNLGAFLYLLA